VDIERKAEKQNDHQRFNNAAVSPPKARGVRLPTNPLHMDSKCQRREIGFRHKLVIMH